MINLNTGKQLSASVKLQTSLPPRLLENNLVIFNTKMRKLTKTKGGHSSLSELNGPPKEQKNFTVKDLGPLRRPQCQKSMQVGV